MNRTRFTPFCAFFTVAAVMVLLTFSSTVHAADEGFQNSGYHPYGKCGAFPRVRVTTPDWACVGVVAGPELGFEWPRSVLQIAPRQFAVTDMVAWSARGRGLVHILEIGDDGTPEILTRITGRNLPHGLARGPDGWIYVGDDDSIWRFHPERPIASVESVFKGLPGKTSRGGDHWHPLSTIVFDLNGNLIINFGAPNDDCAKVPGRSARFPYPCPFVDGPKPDAAVYSLAFTWPQGKPGVPGALTLVARGLRNSMALAVHPRSGILVQAENNIDKWNGRNHPELPPEEINVVRQDGNYGWPYCVGDGDLVREYRGRGRALKDCKGFDNPAILMPSHAAPLGMVYYHGAMFPELHDKLLIALHGFREWGHRIVAYDTAEDGTPIAPAVRRGGFPGLPMALVDGWEKRSGVRPTGRPVSLDVATDGSIWFVDDKAKAVMVIARSGPSDGAENNPEEGLALPPEVIAKVPEGWADFYRATLKPRCATCHEQFRAADPTDAWWALAVLGFTDAETPQNSPMFERMLGEGGGRPMPPPGGIATHPADAARLKAFLSRLQPVATGGTAQTAQ